ncbi:DVUA0089 family protein [Massilia consociata]|uniref:DVUA0089 family protein n=1 Tax=Massilia consociata TaxID=760117 RepID=A0ABV6FFU1_9BURK
MKLKPIALLALCAAMSSAGAANMSYTGQFTYDNDVQLINFTVGELSTVGLRTWSYAGGVNAAGETIARGGFDPIVALFNSVGQLVGEQDDAGCGKVAADAVTRQCWDINFLIELAPGTYTASIQQYNNYHVSTNLADGFYYQDAQYRNFRNGFVDEMDVKRNGMWALDILNVTPPAAAPVDLPEPGSLGLIGLALAGMTVLRRRSKAA